MRVLHVTNAGGFGRLQRGGGERAVEELSAGFSAIDGWTAAVIAPEPFLTSANLASGVVRIPVGLGDFSLSRALSPRSNLRRAFRDYRPTVVITHLLRGSLVGIPLARTSTDAGVISNLHNSLRDSVSHGDAGLAGQLNLAAFRLVGRAADAHIAISPSNQRDLLRFDRMPPSKVHLISNWVSDAFTGLERHAAANVMGAPLETRMLVVGRLEAQKRQDFVLDLLRELPDNVQLDIVGEGSREQSYRALAERLGVSARVRFLGHRTDIPELMSVADIVLVPSAFEGFGRVAIEALSVGTRVLASDVAGLRDVLGSAPAGSAAILAPEDRSRWLAAITEFSGVRPTADQISEMRRYAAEHYSFDVSFSRYRDLAAQLSARHS